MIAQTNLGAFHYPGMSAEEFMRLQYGADVDAWDYLNRTMKGQRLLTHENRHYALAPEITLVHLDDWDIQKAYTMTDDREKMALLRELGIRYYYAIPNEEKHAVTRRVGLDAWKKNGWLREVRRWNGNVLYELNWGAAGLSDTAGQT